MREGARRSRLRSLANAGTRKVPYSIIDPNTNPHLFLLEKEISELNNVLSSLDSSNLNFEIYDFADFKAKPVGELIQYIQSKRQELLIIQSLIFFESKNNSKIQDTTANKHFHE